MDSNAQLDFLNKAIIYDKISIIVNQVSIKVLCVTCKFEFEQYSALTSESNSLLIGIRIRIGSSILCFSFPNRRLHLGGPVDEPANNDVDHVLKHKIKWKEKNLPCSKTVRT